MESTLSQRVKMLLREHSMSETRFSKETGIKQVTLNRQLKGASQMSALTIEATLMAFPEVSAEWLLRGEGEMVRKPSDGTPSDSVLSERIRSLEALIAEKDERIKELKMLVELLRK